VWTNGDNVAAPPRDAQPQMAQAPAAAPADDLPF